MANRKKYVFGIIICVIFLVLSLIIIPLISGEDRVATQLIVALFSLCMAWGIYRGLRHLFYKPKPSLNPTFKGVEYHPYPVPLKKVALDFFNPLKMELHTMLEIFIVGSLGIYTVLIGPKLSIYFWVFLIVLITLKGGLIIQILRLTKGQNEYGKHINETFGEFNIKYDVTEDMINADGAESERIITPVRQRVNVCGTYDDYTRNMSNFTPEQRYILAVNHYVSEVYGMSHYDFLTSSQGIVYKDAIDGLITIGATKYAEILQRAAEKFDGINHPIFDTDDRKSTIDKLKIDFEDDDDALYELDIYGDKIEALMIAYIRKNSSSFIFKQP